MEAEVFQSVENVEATASLVQHLTELGHRRILFVGGLRGLSTSEELVEGYRLGLAPSGLSYDRSLVCYARSAAEPPERAVGALLIKRDLPDDAIVSASRYMTICVLLALQWYGLPRTDDMPVVAYDDLDIGDDAQGFFEFFNAEIRLKLAG